MIADTRPRGPLCLVPEPVVCAAQQTSAPAVPTSGDLSEARGVPDASGASDGSPAADRRPAEVGTAGRLGVAS